MQRELQSDGAPYFARVDVALKYNHVLSQPIHSSLHHNKLYPKGSVLY